ncbi:MAG: right-handed parallel beta-helix repeat-containing protein [Actinomycetota bacterium]|nr:right-handed parallel beta-helix repeat-containing protein [Actinomycetota bacterium]MDQ6945861.1 right-handed parallel beta-helix repeat-containing protein [Actinomycetota bacterium]
MAAVGLALLMVSTGLVGTAAAQNAVGCGSVITKSTTLTADVGPCPDAGLIVAADNVVLNLNGHTVTGNPQLRGNGPDAAGVLLRQVHGVTVKNGTVQHFDAGVSIDGGAMNTVSAITAQHNVNYRLVTGRNALPGDIDLNNGPFCDLGDGIAVVGSNGNLILHNTLMGNGPYDGIALIDQSDRNTLANNEVADNDLLNQPPGGAVHGTICGGLANIGPLGRWTQDVGMRIEGPGAQHNVLTGNHVVRNGLAGIMVTAFVTAFPMANNGFNKIIGNTISQTGLRTHQLNDQGDEYRSSGIYLHNSGSSHVSLSYGNLIASNNSSGNFGGGIEALGPFPGSRQVGVGGNTIVGNLADNNLLDGIILAAGTVDTTVSGNTAHGNAPDKALIAAINARDIYTVWDGTDGSDNSVHCDHNVWSGNQFGTVNQPCVRTGKVVGPIPSTPMQAANASPPPSAQAATRPLRRGSP